MVTLRWYVLLLLITLFGAFLVLLEEAATESLSFVENILNEIEIAEKERNPQKIGIPNEMDTRLTEPDLISVPSESASSTPREP